MQGELAQAGIFVAGEQRFAFLPQTLVGVHARTVVSEERFGHQRGGLAVFASHVFDDVFVEHHIVGGAHQGVEAKVDFRLAGGSHFVVLAFDADAELFHHQAHFGADVLLGVPRGDRKITFLVSDFVTQIGQFLPSRVPNGLPGIDLVESAVAFGVELDVVEDEKFSLRSENGAVRDAGGSEVFFGALSDAAWIAGIGLFGAGFGDGAGE